MGLSCGVEPTRGQKVQNLPKIYNNSTNSRSNVANMSVAYKAQVGVANEGSLYSNNPHSMGSRSNSQCSSHKQRSNSVRSNDRSAETHLLSVGASVGVANVSGMHGMNSPQMYGVYNNQQQQQLQQQQLQQQRLLVSSGDIPSAELFYNPNQINVARKFFKKQKRLAKRNNFELQRQQHQNYDDTSDISSLTGGSDRGHYGRGHNALTLLSGGGRKVNNTNIYYGGMRGGMLQEDKHSIMNNSNHKAQLAANMVANIYTNIPETSAPQHEVIKMRGSRLGAATPSKLAADVLSEHDEEETSGSMEEHVPLYENTRLKVATPTPTKMAQSEVAAMNSLGLPDNNTTETRPEVAEDEGLIDKESVALGTNDIYISNSLQITDCVNIDETFPLMTLIRGREQQQQQSKSLNNINDIFNLQNNNNHSGNNNNATKIEGVVVGGGVISATVTTLAISRSTDNLTEKQQQTNETTTTTTTTPTSTTTTTTVGKNNEHYYDISTTPCVLSASPTNESDLNYQNSELSIRSHDVYAPQADNELNLTLTDDFPPYLGSSNTSDGDDEHALAELNNDDEDELGQNEAASHDVVVVDNNFNGHCLDDQYSDITIADDAEDIERGEVDALMNSSIDELYEAIKRRPIVASNYTTSSTLPMGANNNNNQIRNKTEANKQQQQNLNETMEDDSSQSSVISYIDPKVASSSSQTPSS